MRGCRVRLHIGERGSGGVLDVLDDGDAKARGRFHGHGFGAFEVDGLVALDVFEALGGQKRIGLIKIIHIHPDEHLIPLPGRGRGNNVHVEALGVFHAGAGHLSAVDGVGGRVVRFKAQRFKQLDEGRSVGGYDDRVPG